MESKPTLKELYDLKQYADVVALYEGAETAYAFNEWDYLYIMNSLYKLERYADCLALYKVFHKSFAESDKLDDKLGWALYHEKMKNYTPESGTPTELRKQIDFVLSHSSDSVYSPRLTVVRFAIKALTDGKLGFNPENALIERYLDALNPDALSTEARKTQTADGKTRETASDAEWWYSQKTKLLLKMQHFDECLTYCNRAFDAITVFHNNNDSWISYRRAKALQALERGSQAKAIVKEIIQSGFRHWCLYQLLFELYRDEGSVQQALGYGSMCALTDDEHDKRVGFYWDFADFLDKNGFDEEAMLHRHFMLILRDENQWRITPEMVIYKTNTEFLSLDKQETLQRLTPFWQEQRGKNEDYHVGTVTRVLHEGRDGDGFIDDRYYFKSKDIHGKKRDWQEGTQVHYTTAQRMDKKKNEMKPNAVDITIL